jgi:Tol biopolymer transport system component
VINPNNERARELMDRLERKERDREAEAEVVPGVSRRQLTLIAGGGGGLVLLIVLLLVVIAVTRGNEAASTEATATALVQAVTSTFEVQSAAETSVVETQIASVGTDTPTPRPIDLPPTFTPSPPPSATATPFVGPPPPPDLPGNVAVFGGIDVLSNGALEFYSLPANTQGQETRIGSENLLGRDVRFVGGTSRVIYTRYFNTTQDFGMEATNINGTQTQLIRATQGVLNTVQPDQCNTSNQVAFVGVPAEILVSEDNLNFDMEPPRQLFVLDLDAPDSSSAMRRMTNDSATYSYPAFSPDCSKIAVVRDDQNSAQPGPDIVVIDFFDPSFVVKVTTDFGNFLEEGPRWSHDGTRLIFAAAQATSPTNRDVIIANADGSGSPQVPVSSPEDDIFPVFGPQGQYIAWSSQRQGVYNVFIIRLSDGQEFQLTNAGTNRFVGDWRQ